MKILVIRTKKTELDESFIDRCNSIDSKLSFEYGYLNESTIYLENLQEPEIFISDKNIKDYDLVYIKTFFSSYAPVVYVIKQILNSRNIPLLISQNVESFDKLSQTTEVNLKGFPIPKTLFLSKDLINWDSILSKLKAPFIMKAIFAEKGKNNYLISDRKTFESVFKNFENKKTLFIFQEFIENEEDFRVLMMGGEVVKVFSRKRKYPHSHLNNLSQGGKKINLKIDTLGLNIEAFKIYSVFKQPIMGIDFIVKDKVYFLEVNANPGLSKEDQDEKLLIKLIQDLS